MDNTMSIDAALNPARLPPTLPHEPIINDPTKPKIDRASYPWGYPCDHMPVLR